jgi:hypothetical protein
MRTELSVFIVTALSSIFLIQHVSMGVGEKFVSSLSNPFCSVRPGCCSHQFEHPGRISGTANVVFKY